MELKERQIVPGLVSVIMTNYNTPEEYLRQAIDSILNQTYSNLEFIIVDDCSTDNSLSVIESYEDKRIIILKNSKNIGLTKSLNKALAVCEGEFIARMDSDDISEPERFEKQIQYLKDHYDVVVCGTWAKLFGEWKNHNSSDRLCRTIPERAEFRIYQLFGNNPNIVHISAMFNRRLMIKGDISYDERYIYAQDYRMWISCSEKYNCYIIPEFLVNIRVREGTISTSKKGIQDDCVLRIIQEQLDKLHLTLTEEVKPYHVQLLTSRKPYNILIKKWMMRIIVSNKQYKIYNQRLLKKLLLDKWAEICYFGFASQNSIKGKIAVFFSLPLSRYIKVIQIRNKRKKKREG